MEGSATKTAGAIKTEVLKTPGNFAELVNILVLHELLNIKQRPSETSASSDPAHKKDQKNELAVAQFRIYFKEEKPELTTILDEVFVIMKTSDYQRFSLSVLESVVASAYVKYDPKDENNIGQERPFFLEKITTASSGGSKGGKGETPKQSMVVMPNFHFKGNYQHFINLIATAITNNNRDPKKTIRWLDECGIISQSVITRLARYFTPDNWGKFLRLFKELPEEISRQLNPLLEEILPKTEGLKEQAKERFAAAKASRQN